MADVSSDRGFVEYGLGVDRRMMRFSPFGQEGQERGPGDLYGSGHPGRPKHWEEVFTFLCDGETATLTLRQLAGDEMTIQTQEYSAPDHGGGSIFVGGRQASGAFEYAVEDKPGE